MNYKEKIKKSGYKKSFLAEKLGVTNVYFSKLINGKTPISIKMEKKLKELFLSLE